MRVSKRELLCFDDVLIRPQYSDISSRSAISLDSDCNGLDLELPVFSAPMDTVTEYEMAYALGGEGGQGVIHRYNTIEQQVRICSGNSWMMAAIGVSGDYLERATELYRRGVRRFCIDVAHGHTSMMREALKTLRAKFGDDIHIMAGNVATLEAFNDLADWGADSIRVGIGGGCFAEGTMIMTEDGLAPIEKIEVGTKVYTHKNRLREVTKTFTHEGKDTFVAVNGIEATPNHEFYVLHKSKAEIANDNNIHELAEWISADRLTKDYFLLKLSKFELVEIESLETTENPSGIAYDLEVDEDHSYNVEGVVVHNSICSTRIQTGHGMPTFASVLECSHSDRDASLVADGGIRNAGDIVKALGAGADAVMLGSMLSATDESPGEVIFIDGERYKTYRGMASREAQFDWRGHAASLEGVSSVVPCKGSVKNILADLSSRIRSGLSYSGARSLEEFHATCQFEKVSSLSVRESSTHIFHVHEK